MREATTLKEKSAASRPFKAGRDLPNRDLHDLTGACGVRRAEV
jgi:hypothetical protein